MGMGSLQSTCCQGPPLPAPSPQKLSLLPIVSAPLLESSPACRGALAIPGKNRMSGIQSVSDNVICCSSLSATALHWQANFDSEALAFAIRKWKEAGRHALVNMLVHLLHLALPDRSTLPPFRQPCPPSWLPHNTQFALQLLAASQHPLSVSLPLQYNTVVLGALLAEAEQILQALQPQGPLTGLSLTVVMTIFMPGPGARGSCVCVHPGPGRTHGGRAPCDSASIHYR